jgi:hypothetical protein
MLSIKDVSPVQVGASIFAGLWFLFVPGYFNPEKDLTKYTGVIKIDPNDKLSAMAKLAIMGISGYGAFFGLTCAVAAADAKVARPVMMVQTLMSAFFLRFHYAVSPGLNALNDESLTMLRRAWGGGLAIGLASLLLDGTRKTNNK